MKSKMGLRCIPDVFPFAESGKDLKSIRSLILSESVPGGLPNASSRDVMEHPCKIVPIIDCSSFQGIPFEKFALPNAKNEGYCIPIGDTITIMKQPSYLFIIFVNKFLLKRVLTFGVL